MNNQKAAGGRRFLVTVCQNNQQWILKGPRIVAPLNFTVRALWSSEKVARSTQASSLKRSLFERRSNGTLLMPWHGIFKSTVQCRRRQAAAGQRPDALCRS
jgi:hypothetical protein